MPRLTDLDRLKAYTDALSNWKFGGYVQFRLTEQAHKWIRRELGNIALKEIGRLMHEYVSAGGVIDEVPETRSTWRDLYEFHYDLRFAIESKLVYLETRLNYRVPIVADESSILVVNIHEP